MGGSWVGPYQISARRARMGRIRTDAAELRRAQARVEPYPRIAPDMHLWVMMPLSKSLVLASKPVFSPKWRLETTTEKLRDVH